MRKESTLSKSKTDETDYERLDAMKDEDIDFSETPEATAEMFERGVVRKNLKVMPRKRQLTITVDSEVLWWYQKQGSDYRTRIHQVLRTYMEEQSKKQA